MNISKKIDGIIFLDSYAIVLHNGAKIRNNGLTK